VPDYTRLPALQHYVLEYSYVLGVVAKPSILEVEIDLALTRDHSDLLPPREGEVNRRVLDSWSYPRRRAKLRVPKGRGVELRSISSSFLASRRFEINP
jgi:hypothetical protein